MTWMYTLPEGIDAFVNLRPSMLDDRSWYVPYIETYRREALPWAKTQAVYSYAEFPEMSAYEGLIREYAEKGAQPRQGSSNRPVLS